MLVVLDAGHREFRTGWFVESLATQTLVPAGASRTPPRHVRRRAARFARHGAVAA